MATKDELSKLATRDELKIESAAIRLEIANVRTELKEEISKLIGDSPLLKCMVGVSITLSIAIIAKMFLG